MLTFAEDKINGLMLLMSQENKISRKNIKLELNKDYIAQVRNAVLEKNDNGWPVIIVTFKVNIENNQVEYNIRYSLTDVSRNTKMYELRSLLDALNIDKYYISKNSSNDYELLVNTVEEINKAINIKVLLAKKGKATYYKYKINRYEEVFSNE